MLRTFTRRKWPALDSWSLEQRRVSMTALCSGLAVDDEKVYDEAKGPQGSRLQGATATYWGSPSMMRK